MAKNTNIKITGLQDLKELPKEMQKAIKLGSKKSLNYLALQQQAAILKGQNPSGGEQQQNSPNYKARKEALVKKGKLVFAKPLYKTGFLSNFANWKISIGKEKAILKPPASRSAAVYVLISKGYKFVINDLPANFGKKVEAFLQAELDTINNKK